MASFDILSKVDAQALDNAINVTKKEITNRFDFKDSVVNIDLNKKDMKIQLETSDDMKMKQLVEVLMPLILQNHLTQAVKPSNKK
jgi:uncharacterized protein YajQ (UPF0234 family)